jgi:hypothetical protein
MYHSKCRLLYFHVMSTNKHFFFRKPQNCMFPLIFLCTTKLYSSLHLLSSSNFFFFFNLFMAFIFNVWYLFNKLLSTGEMAGVP